MTNEQARIIVALLVSVIWATAAISAIITGRTVVLAAVTTVMMVVAGFLFGYKSAKNGNGNGKGGE